MKLFISADIEGCVGTTLASETHKERPEYQQFAKRMTDEVRIVCQAALEAGADEIVVKDGHGDATNIDFTAMPEGVTLRGAAAYRGSLEKGTYVSCEVYLVAESNLSREEMEVRFEAWEKQLCEAMDGDACTVRVLDGAEAQEAFWQARWYENVRAALPSMEEGCWLVAIGGRTFDMMTNDGVTDRAYRLYP